MARRAIYQTALSSTRYAEHRWSLTCPLVMDGSRVPSTPGTSISPTSATSKAGDEIPFGISAAGWCGRRDDEQRYRTRDSARFPRHRKAAAVSIKT